MKEVHRAYWPEFPDNKGMGDYWPKPGLYPSELLYWPNGGGDLYPDGWFKPEL